MQIKNLNLAYFSPTRTTRNILFAIASSIAAPSKTDVDLTLPATSEPVIKATAEELTVFGAPVYAGRIPPDALKRLARFKGDNSAAVIVVTYGNREFEDALLELQHLAERNGFRPVAAAAFIGEHSYSTAEKPIAPNRPDQSDLTKAQQFGRTIQEKLSQLTALTGKLMPPLPGDFPYKEINRSSDIKPLTDQALCSECRECAAVCPTSAISVSDPDQTDETLCIYCCACVKICPTGARQMNDPRIRQIADWLFTNCGTRKEPEIFI